MVGGLFLSMLCLGQDTNTNRKVHFREPHPTHYELIGSNPVAGARWTPARLDDSSASRVELSSRVVLQIEPGIDFWPWLATNKLAWARTIFPSLHILQAADAKTAIDAAEALAAMNGVVSAYPVMRRALKRHGAYAPAPNDSYFGELWHLENRAPDGNLAGADLNARGAWPWARGDGVVVGVGDCGIQLTHPELVNRVAADLHYNFFRDTAEGGPDSASASHATAVAGLIAAEADNLRGVAGVAPQARLASWVIFGTSALTGEETVASDEQLMDMFQYASNRVGVQNHSWGSASTAQSALDTLADAGIGNAITAGRGGRGVVIVRAGGNDRLEMANANDDGFCNDPRVVAVAAVRKNGRVCSYSTPGACLLVAAPSGDVLDSDGDGEADTEDPTAPGVLTTDRTGTYGYTSGTTERASYTTFNGTSASAPLVAGVAALILSIQPDLSYRDVQHLLVQSAHHYDLDDPDARLNGAGFRFSHNLGFGVPDAGLAATLARQWTNRPAARRVTAQSSAAQVIPDDALRVVCTGTGLGASLASIRCLPSQGLHPDEATAALPLAYVGLVTEEITQDLHGQAALIQRGTSTFEEKISRAARAGAAFAIIFNNTGTTNIQAMGGTTFVPIPAVSIGRSQGIALRDFLTSHPETTGQLQLTPAVYPFAVTDTLVCEHVGVRLKTTHTSRADVRVTLRSPMGTRSVLQAINADSSNGPADWTYWTAQHFYESSAGEWRLEVSDERNTTVRVSPSRTVAATGSVTFVQILLDGVTLTDADRDGLDDAWEDRELGGRGHGPKDDPDDDGFNNAREQALGTAPRSPNAVFRVELAALKSGYWRLSWPASENHRYTVLGGSRLGLPLGVVTEIAGTWPVAEYVVHPATVFGFYDVLQGDDPVSTRRSP